MRILFIVQNIIGQGTFLRAFELAKALGKLDHSVTILASSRQILKRPEVIIHDGVQIVSVSNFFPGPTRSGWDVYNLLVRKKLIRSLQFDIVHGFESRPTVIFPALLLRRKGIPLFLDWADWFGKGGSVEERPNPILRNVLRPIESFFENHYRIHPLGTTVICKTLEKRANEFGVNRDRLCLLYNGFNSEHISILPVQIAKRNCGLDSKFTYIGYLGSFFQNDAILAAKAINHLRLHQRNIKLIHIGSSNYHLGPHINDPDSIIETGPINYKDLNNFLSSCDVFWLPMKNSNANQGRFPIKFTDYLSHGRPIVCTNVGDIPNFVNKYKTGLVTNDAPEEISSATSEILANSSVQKNMKINALNLSNNPDHSWVSRAKDLLSFYNQTIQG